MGTLVSPGQVAVLLEAVRGKLGLEAQRRDCLVDVLRVGLRRPRRVIDGTRCQSNHHQSSEMTSQESCK